MGGQVPQPKNGIRKRSMNQKSNIQKGFIQIPLIVIVVISVIVAPVGIGVVLYGQRRLASLTAIVSRAFKETEETDEISWLLFFLEISKK